MTNMVIIDSTDGHFIGFEFDGDASIIELPNGAQIFVEKIIPTSSGYRFYNTNYTIEAIPTDG